MRAPSGIVADMDKLCFGIEQGSETGFGGQATAFGGVGWVAAVQAHARMLGLAGSGQTGRHTRPRADKDDRLRY